jgi:hypothetical protein
MHQAAAAPFVAIQQIIASDNNGAVSHSVKSSQLRDLSPNIGIQTRILPRHHADAGRP